MLEIANTKIFGLEDSMARSGLPTRLGRPDIEELRYGSAKRARKLGKVKPGTGHDVYLRGIRVQFDIKYSAYISMQLQRYHHLEIISSQSKMYSLAKANIAESVNKYVDPAIVERVEQLQAEFNANRTYENRMRLLSNCPMGYEMWMGIDTNYAQIKTIVKQRRGHRLKEDWTAFVEWAESLPRFKELCFGVCE